jgi:hypothetical protein
MALLYHLLASAEDPGTLSDAAVADLLKKTDECHALIKRAASGGVLAAAKPEAVDRALILLHLTELKLKIARNDPSVQACVTVSYFREPYC